MSVRPLPRLRSLVLSILAALGLVAAGVEPASAGTSSSEGPATYLALGDSVPFGYYNSPYNPLTDPVDFAAFYRNPDQFVGYADDIAAARHLQLANASCPGESSGSFIDTTLPSFGCENVFRLLAPLHVGYTGSQLAFAEHFLRTTSNVRLVTIQLGANDVFVCQASGGCTTPPEIQAVAARVGSNLGTILTALRGTGYRGQIEVLDYYSLNYADQQGTASALVLDKAIDAAALADRETVVSAFAAFLPIAWAAGGGDSRAAGLVRPAPDDHPTPFGHRVLALAAELAGRL
jgi:lysophospholipase L1-like esterase